MITGLNSERTQVVKSDILILGGGIAGCMAALRARESGLEVTLVDKGCVGRSGMSHQMSGVLTYFDPEEDDHDAWYKECIEVGQGLVDQERLEGMISETTSCIRNLENWGVTFQRENGRLIRRAGVGHIHARNILMAKGGLEMMSVLRGEVVRNGVCTVERTMVTHLLTSDGELPTGGQVVGAVGFNVRTGAFYIFEAKAIVIATGSTSSICPAMTMPVLSGDGKAMAFRAGCEMRNVELSYFVDYPVGLNCAPGSNILYGEGAVLINRLGERFMQRYDPIRLDRAGRAAHTRAMAIEEIEGRGPVYLDATHLDDAAHSRIEKCIPIVARSFEMAGLSLKRDRIPYSIGLTDHSAGGIRVSSKGETTLPGLYAAGAATDHAQDGVTNVIAHGMESAIEGSRAGQAAAKYATAGPPPAIRKQQTVFLKGEIFAPMTRKPGPSHQEVRNHCMTLWKTALGPIRNEKGLTEAINTAQKIREDEIPRIAASDFHELARTVGLGNELLLLELLPRCALLRTESRGSHYREDYPERDDVNWVKWVIAKKEGDAIKVWAEAIPSREKGANQ